MKNRIVNNQPQEVTDYPSEEPIDQNAIECINEIFKSPLIASYNWDYTVVDDRIKKLYELGKQLNWNVTDDLDWSQNFPKDEFMINSEIFKALKISELIINSSFGKFCDQSRSSVTFQLSCLPSSYNFLIRSSTTV